MTAIPVGLCRSVTFALLVSNCRDFLARLVPRVLERDPPVMPEETSTRGSVHLADICQN